MNNIMLDQVVRASSLKPGDCFVRMDGSLSMPVSEVFRDKRSSKVCVGFMNTKAVEFMPWDRRIQKIWITPLPALVPAAVPQPREPVGTRRKERVQKELNLFPKEPMIPATCESPSFRWIKVSGTERYSPVSMGSMAGDMDSDYTFKEILLSEGWSRGEILAEFNV